MKHLRLKARFILLALPYLLSTQACETKKPTGSVSSKIDGLGQGGVKSNESGQGQSDSGDSASKTKSASQDAGKCFKTHPPLFLGSDCSDAPKGLPLDASLASFKTTVYEPIFARYCSDCHGCDNVYGQPPEELPPIHCGFLKMMNFSQFEGVPASLPARKMREVHNCWEASQAECVAAMDQALEGWIAALKAAGYQPTPKQP